MEEQNILKGTIKKEKVVYYCIEYPAYNAKNQSNKYYIEPDFICFT